MRGSAVRHSSQTYLLCFLLCCLACALVDGSIFSRQLENSAQAAIRYIPYGHVDLHCGNGTHITPQLFRIGAQERWLEPWFKPETKPLCTPLGLLFVCQVPEGPSDHHSIFPHWRGRHLRGSSSLSWLWHSSGGQNDERLDREKIKQALRIAFENDTTMSPAAYMRGVVQGEPGRLGRALRKLVTGQPVKVVLLGGSVAVGMGVVDRNNSFASLLAKWFQSFKTITGDNVQFINSAVAATTSSYASQCVDDFVPSDTDIVFLEYALNDWEVVDSAKVSWMDNYQRRGYERLIRKISAFPNAPAIILTHWWSPPHFNYSFWNVAEDQFDTMAKYYGLSSISFRNAYYHQIMTAANGFNLTDFLCDHVHPNILGHRYFADLIIGHLQHSLVEALLLPYDEGLWLNGLPPPLFEGNNATSGGKCVRDDAFKSTVVSAQGFEWKNQAKEGAPQAKWGYVGLTPGSYLVIDVGSGDVGPSSNIAPRQTIVALGVLKSYEDMGVATISCRSSHEHPKECVCNNWQIDLHHQHHTSQVYWISGLVTTGPHCLLQVTIANETTSGAHKVVVTSLMVGDDSADDIRAFSSFGSYPIEVEGDNSSHPP
eukprot:jgi/Botrbrau1/17695/Bobra.0166s0119.1